MAFNLFGNQAPQANVSAINLYFIVTIQFRNH